MEDRTGQRLDTYRLLRYLGSGSFGVVYLAEHITHHRSVAIKIFPRFADKDLPTFLNEARTIRLKHPHILPVLDFGIDKSEPFIVTEYISAGTMRMHYPKGVCLPVARVGPYIRQIASALQYAHDEKLIHRDVKPENIMMRSDTDLLLGDFGVVAIAHSSLSLPEQNTAGTLHYMAPEQIQGKAVPASDQYALGVIAYEWLCGERPFQGSVGEIIGQHMKSPPPSLRQKRADLPRSVEDVIWKALAKEPVQRFPSVMAFANALNKASNPLAQGKKTTSEIPSIFLPLDSASAENSSVSRKTPAIDTQLQTHLLSPGRSRPPAQSAPDSSAIGKSQPGESLSISRSNPSSLSGLEATKPRRFPLLPLLILLLLVLLILAIGIGGAYYLTHMDQRNKSLHQTLNTMSASQTDWQREAALQNI